MKTWGLTLALAGALVCPTVAQEVTVDGPLPALLEIEDPNLEGVDAAVADRITEDFTRIRALKEQAEVDPLELAAAYGSLGETLFLYEILDQAERAFKNARSLMPAFHRWHYFLGALTQELRRLDASREHFRKVLEIDPRYLPALIRLGQIETLANQLDAAKDWYRRALEILPTSPAAHWGLGQIALGEGAAATAAGHFESVLETQPSATAAHYPLALAYRDLGEVDKAREHLKLRGEQRVSPSDPLIDGLAQRVAGASMYMTRGNQAFSRGMYEMASLAYRKAVEADADSALARHALATSLMREGKIEEALEHLETVVEQDSENALAHYNIGTIQSERLELDAAMFHLQRAVELDPDLANAHFNLGVLLDRQGDVEAALEHYRAARDLNPEDSDAVVRYAELLARLGQPAAAETHLRAVLEVDPSNPGATLAMGSVLESLGRASEAIALYSSVSEDSEDQQLRARALLAAGQLELGRSRIDSAIGYLSRMVDLVPGVAGARSLLAAALARGGYFSDAATQYETVILQSPDYRPAHFGRAMALLLARRDADAVAGLEESLGALPAEPELEHLLARVLATSEDKAVRNGGRALEFARRSLDRQQSLRNAETVAMALAELGRYDEAAALQRQIRDQAEAAGVDDLATIDRRLAGYEQRQPVRTPWLGG